MNLNGKLAVFLVLSLLIVGLVGCINSNPVPNEMVKVGAILPLSGDSAILGVSMQEGILLAVEETNQAGGIGGKKVDVFFEDDHFSNTASATAASKLIVSDQIDVGITALINEAKAVQPIFEENKIPLLVGWDSTSEIENSQYLFSAGFSTEANGKKMADFAFDDLQLRKIAVVLHQDEWAEIIAPAFQKEFESKGGKIVLFEKVPVGEDDFRTVISKVKTANADGIYFPLVPINSDLFLKQVREQNLNVQLLTGDAFIPDVVLAAGTASENVYFTNIFTEDNAVAKQLLESYRQKYGKEPDALPMVAFGYDSVMAIAKAAESAGGTDSESIARGLYTVDIEGAGGRIKINPNGLADRVEKIYQIQNGEPVLAG